MQKSHLVARIYGYLVCLVAVITFLICISQLINSIIDLGDPIHAGWQPESSPCLASYENYKMDVLKVTTKSNQADNVAYIPSDETLHSMYNAACNDKIQLEKHRAKRTIVLNAMLTVISILLFISHWRWISKQAKLD